MQADALRSVTVLRLILIGMLVMLQSLDLNGSVAFLSGTLLWILPAVIMNGLFALTGFTMARSLERNGAWVTLRRTAWRFLPALAIVVGLTALVAGAALTEQRKAIYFSDPQVWTYLLNIIGYPQDSLPGVFIDNNRVASVNDATWVVPVAYLCIGMITLAAGRLRHGSLVLAGAAVCGVGLGYLLQSGLVRFSDSINLTGFAGGRSLNAAIAFLGGALAYRERTRIIMDARFAAVIALGGLVLVLPDERRALESPLIGPVFALASGYVTLFAGAMRLPLRHAVQRSEPFLWRVFLVAYPVQQFWIAKGPNQQGVGLNLALSIPVIVLLAGVMWFGLELPILRRFAPEVVSGHPAYAVQERSMRRGQVLNPIAAMRAALPHIAAAVFIVLLTLGAIAIAVFALQRDPGGV